MLHVVEHGVADVRVIKDGKMPEGEREPDLSVPVKEGEQVAIWFTPFALLDDELEAWHGGMKVTIGSLREEAAEADMEGLLRRIGEEADAFESRREARLAKNVKSYTFVEGPR